MPSTAESIFKDKLELYKKQKAEVAKETNKRFQTDKTRKDFQQQRGVQYQTVINTANTPVTEGSIGPRGISRGGIWSLGNYKDKAQHDQGAFFRNYGAARNLSELQAPRGDFGKSKATKRTGGDYKILGAGGIWTTNGYKAMALDRQKERQTKEEKAKPKPKKLPPEATWSINKKATTDNRMIGTLPSSSMEPQKWTI